ncbi:MAG: cytochrome c [Bacteroidota bacterium]|nr:cytochrome c [Bacteroidota bacterium]
MNRITVITLFLLFSLTMMAQDWVVPEDKRGKLSPFNFNDVTRKAGERLYTINCISCHGTPGKGNFLNLVPPPGDPATDKIQHNSDGEIFFKVSNGRGLMPSFKNVLSSNDIWNLISFLRSFKPGYVQSVMTVSKSTAYPGAVIGISFILSPGKDEVQVRITAANEKSSVPVKMPE